MIARIRGSILFKTALLVLGTTCLVMALTGFYQYRVTRNLILEAAEENAGNLTLSAVRRIQQEFRAVQTVTRSLTAFLKIHPPDSEAVLESLLERSVADNPEIFGAGLYLEPGVLPDTPGALTDKPGAPGDASGGFAAYCFQKDDSFRFRSLLSSFHAYSREPWYALPAVLGHPVWSDPYLDKGDSNALMVTYSVPVYRSGPDPDFVGVVTADISLVWLSGLVSDIRVGETGFAFIISETGVFVSHPRQEMILHQSIFSVADLLDNPELRAVGREMLWNRSGFRRIGPVLAGEVAYLAYHRIPDTGWALGTALLRKELFADLISLQQKTALLAGVGLVLLLLASMLLSRTLSRPLLSMEAAARKIARGDLDVDLSHIRRTDELGRLAVSLDRMAEGLRQKEFIRDTFGRYLTREVVARLLESKEGLKLGGEAREITLIMSDLRGFTALTAHMAPQEIISFLNRYLGRMVDILADHGGVVDEIIGDGILAFFGAPEPMADHPRQAVTCALKMQAAMEAVNDLNARDGLAHLEMGIAVHTATVVVGNIGSEKRSKYGAVGSGVNFTGRMESATVGGQVLVSQATRDRIGEGLTIREKVRLRMKGLPEKVTLYDVTGIDGPDPVSIPVRDDTPSLLDTPVRVRVNRVNRKILGKQGRPALLTHTSRTSAVLQSETGVAQWEDIAVTLPEGLFYAKVVETSRSGDIHEITVRTTSMSPEAYALFSGSGSQDRDRTMA